MRRKRLLFTLMEMLVVMTLIVIVAGVIGINISGAVREARFRSGSELVLDKLQMAQDLMLIMKQDVRIKFMREGDQLKCTFEVDAKLTPALKSIMNKNAAISGIKDWTFIEGGSHRQQEGNFNLDFAGGGTKMSRGELHLYGADRDKEHETIVLTGYPRPLGKGTAKDPVGFTNENSYEALYPKEVRRIIEEASPPKNNEQETLPSS